MNCLSSFDRRLESTHGFETNFLKILYYEFPHYYKDTYHSYEYPRLCTIQSGQKHVQYGDYEPFTYDDSQFVLLPPNSNVLMEISIPTRALVLEISDHLIQEVSERITNDLKIDLPKKSHYNRYDFNLMPHVNDSFRQVVKACFGEDRNKAFLMDLHAQELAYHLIRVKSIYNILNERLSDPTLHTIWYMTTNYSQKVTVKELAGMANMSINAYIIQFKKFTGMTPVEYRTRMKMSRARDLLRSHTVTETAMELGYENISHFIRLFKETYRATPKQFQKRYFVELSNPDDLFRV